MVTAEFQSLMTTSHDKKFSNDTLEELQQLYDSFLHAVNHAASSLKHQLRKESIENAFVMYTFFREDKPNIPTIGFSVKCEKKGSNCFPFNYYFKVRLSNL